MNIKQDHKKIDSSDMYSVLKNLPIQFDEATKSYKNFKGYADTKSVSSDVVIFGMGGSAIAGEILKDFFQFSEFKTKIKIHISREYELPAFVDDKAYLIFSSYSGETEETLSAFEKAQKLSKRIVCISSGGKLIELAKNSKYKFLQIPTGLQPRCAIGYSLTALFYTIINSPLVNKTEAKKIITSFNKAIEKLREISEKLSILDDSNIAYNIAKIFQNSCPLIISSSKFNAINLRWRGQIQENAKQLSFGVTLPEMNHNFINGLENPKYIVNKIAVINFISKLDNDRIAKRFTANSALLKDKVDSITDISHSSEEYFSAMLELLCLGDWISYFIAIIRGIDPTPIPMISKLKEIMAEAN